ncbi:MAG: hypothetical protein A3B31_02110 [Candidatus Komeilibacteria bacterium RIFCSPLOWO2_01_FULL_53_11]|uniref:Phosphoglycerate mutase n=1 Tax=Candidatus Komeilibacteria bacterium RIFCSPLOWO2_01_FULL_53_11 TaxID=1798552 RepID=A0A1G2BT96_9BACT|nr:MAG: hypothetical protein A3B31_02110 [Candidatus Komeilibacteria bacterium RIFCSPLOWO2_01_FULL_53_11]
MKHFYLVRHTEFENPDEILHGRLPLRLSEKGREQALQIAKKLKRKKVARIYSSPVVRCRETSQILGKELGVPIVYDQRLLEVLTVMQGMKLTEYAKVSHRVYSIATELGGETMIDIQLRMMDFFFEKVKKETDNIVICSHGDPLYLLYLGLVRKDLPEEPSGFDDSEYPSKGSTREVKILDDHSLKIGALTRLSK